MHIKIIPCSAKSNIDSIMQSGIKRTIRSLSLLANQNSVNNKQNNSTIIKDIPSTSFDLGPLHKPGRRAPPSKSPNESPIPPKPCIALSPSKVLLEYHDKLSEYEYKEIANYPEIYFLRKIKKSLNGNFCDDRFYYRSFVGDHIAYRYEILNLLGDGSFGIVIQCLDHKTSTPVAIKILRKGKKFSEIGKSESCFLDTLNPDGENEGIIKKLDNFKFRGHYCIVYEMLSLDLYQYLKKNDFRGVSMSVIKRIAIQLIIALKHMHSLGLIHCDLKPENVLFKTENKSGVKLIDFGSTCDKNNKLYSYIQSRYYRAPEVILDSGYNEKIDMWSLGCILFELFKGIPIFQGSNEYDQMCKIVEIIGEIPECLVKNSRRKNVFFNENGKFKDKNGEVFENVGAKSVAGLIRNAEKSFIDFLMDCFKLDPYERIDTEEALAHPWIKGNRVQPNRILT